MDEAHDFAIDFFDMYMKEGLEMFFGYAETADDILRDDFIEEYWEEEDVTPTKDKDRLYRRKSNSDSGSSSSDSTPKKRKVLKKRLVKRTLGKSDCVQ